jgi:nicotinate-nucleotide adenylyltransferase
MVKQHFSAIAIFGGTFDPIHFGHLRTALEVYESFPVKEVRFIPSGIPVHRATPQASAEDRLAMITHAIAPHAIFTVDAYECYRAEPSYTFDTLTYLRHTYPTTPLLFFCMASS